MNKKTVEIKNGKQYIAEFTETDTTEVYKSLANDLIAKKVNNCTYIKSIKRIPLYNGYQKIIVTYDNNCRAIYEVETH